MSQSLIIQDEEKIRTCVSMLRKKIEGIQNLKNVCTTSRYLLRFLYSTNMDVDEAFKRFIGYHEHVASCKSFYGKTGPLDRKEVIERRITTVLPDCDREGRPIFILKTANLNCSQMTLQGMAELDDNWMEYLLYENPAVAGKGICYIHDVKNQPYGFVRWLNINNIKQSLKKIENLPVKEFKIHVVNKNLAFQALLKIAYPLIPESSINHVKFHFTNYESLHKYVDPNVLPKEYGGTKDIDYDSINKKLFSKHDDIVKSYELARNVVKV